MIYYITFILHACVCVFGCVQKEAFSLISYMNMTYRRQWENTQKYSRELFKGFSWNLNMLAMSNTFNEIWIWLWNVCAPCSVIQCVQNIFIQLRKPEIFIQRCLIFVNKSEYNTFLNRNAFQSCDIKKNIHSITSKSRLLCACTFQVVE